MSWASHDLATATVLWRFELQRSLRRPLRIAAGIGLPMLIWLSAGIGKGGLVAEETVGYVEFSFPGTAVLVLIAACVLATDSLMEDRRVGFLQAVLCGPGARGALVAGRSAATVTIAVPQAAIFVVLAPLAGFDLVAVNWPLLAAGLLLAAIALSAAVLALAWWLDSQSSYYLAVAAIMAPLWLLSGAAFPVQPTPWLDSVVALNPLAAALATLHHALRGGTFPASAGALGTLGVSAAAAVGLAVWVCRRRS